VKILEKKLILLDNCRKCFGKGLIVVDNIAYYCDCIKNKTLFKQFKYANIAKEMYKYDFNNFNLQYYSSCLIDPLTNKVTYRQLANMALTAAKKFVADILNNKENTGLMFTGPVGSGKTFLAGCIANRLLAHNKQLLFTVVPDLLDEIKETFNKGGEYTELQLLKKLREVEILILDDLGVHNYTEWTQNKIYSIINYRLNNKLATIITSNLSLEQTDELLGERTTSRIIQMCKVYRLLVEQDIRQIKHLLENKN
jgi:DNA replication protein DnaC